jgi:Na+-transporting NADH:ubiquinone oxidoreductase subunit A
MSNIIRIKRGLNIKLKGTAEKILVKAGLADKYAIKPADFMDVVPKLTVKENDKVKAGTTLFFDKKSPEIKFTSPVSGTVTAINRGERRGILEIVVSPDSEILYEDFGKANPVELTKEQVIEKLLNSGLWPVIKQRPYATIAHSKDTPKAIFISAFDSAPLAPDYDFVIYGHENEFKTGVQALSKLTTGDINLSVNANSPSLSVFSEIPGTKVYQFSGPHPAGNVGIQIHHINPVNKGEIVWYVNPQDVVLIGRLFAKGIYDATVSVALTGSEVKHPEYFKVIKGCSVGKILHDNILSDKVRCISGNVLTGKTICLEGYLGFYDYQITVIPEGRHFDFLGWALPGLNKFSASRAFFSWLNKSREYILDTNYNGGHRAFVMTGEYDKVLPMDILPQHLLKAILAGDIEKMEKLGIYEVAEEDFALCEFVCTSKMEVQEIIRNGLNMMIKEMN